MTTLGDWNPSVGPSLSLGELLIIYWVDILQLTSWPEVELQIPKKANLIHLEIFLELWTWMD